MKKIKAGIIGMGFIGPVHAEALIRLGYVDVVAVADNDYSVAKAKAEQLCIKKVYENYKDLIADDEVEIIHVCSPNDLHFPMTKEIIEAGKHVVCDKPLAMTSDEARELLRLAKEKKVVAAVNFNMRYYAMIHQVKAMIENGDLGKLYAINGSYQQDWLHKETDYNWRVEVEKSGKSRAVADIGSHWMNTIEFVTGAKIIKVCADMATFHKTRKKPLKAIETFSGMLLKPEDYENVPIETEDYASVLLRFDTGAHGSFTVNQVAAGRKNRKYFEIYGSKASVAFSTEEPHELWIGKRDGNNEIMGKDPALAYPFAREIMSYPGGHVEGFADTKKQLYDKIYRSILENRTEKYPDFEEGLRDIIICEAILESAKREKWIDVVE